ncbi:hypothetical protein LCGC14_1436550, partial [marine sediment metagenome]
MQILIASGLEELKRQWVMTKLSKYGLDSAKNWGINPI